MSGSRSKYLQTKGTVSKYFFHKDLEGLRVFCLLVFIAWEKQPVGINCLPDTAIHIVLYQGEITCKPRVNSSGVLNQWLGAPKSGERS